MKILETPYRRAPADIRYDDPQSGSRFSHSLHQKILFARSFPPEKRELLSVQLICKVDAFRGDWHRRIKPEFLTVTYVHTGETMVRINDLSFMAEAGDLILMPPQSDYEFGTDSGSIRSAVVLQGDLLEGILQHFGNRMVFSDNAERDLEKRMTRFFTEEIRDREQAAAWSFELLAALHSAEKQSVLPTALAGVIRKMKSDPAQPLALADLAAEAHVTPRTLTRQFQQYLQTSPHRYLASLRMEKARQMLAWEEFSIKEIALSCGFRDALNFSTGFRKHYGCSPTALRKRQKES